jgi:DNA modification methylase
MGTTHRIIFGDARRMTLLTDKSVHLVVTSPLYWQLKDYGTQGQIGFDDSYEEYINNLNLVWMECHRVLHDGCRLCVNIGDQFARSVYYGRYKIIPIRTEITRFCETIGFDFMGSIIWQKVTTCNTTGGATIMGSFPYPRNGIVKIDYEFILLFKKHGKPPQVSQEIKKRSGLSKEEWNLYFNGHWNFPGEKQSGHLAMFPEELPRRLIRMFSFVGETVLDPFLGSGTTSLAAMRVQRDSVGYEVNDSFEATIRTKLKLVPDLFAKSDVLFTKDADSQLYGDLRQLPYHFVDPLRFDKKVDPRKLRFGSAVSGGDEHDKERGCYRVKEVLSGNLVRLDNDLTVRLLGVSPLKGREKEATEFLTKAVRGQQVFLKFDAVKYDESKHLLAYLYLRNRTFINAHLIKHGYAAVGRRDGITNKTLLKYGD